MCLHRRFSYIYMCACLKRRKERKTMNSQGSLAFYIGVSLTYTYFYISEEKKEDYIQQAEVHLA